jgi:hypothetical protein
MGKKRKKKKLDSGLNFNAQAIVNERNWNVSIFNGGAHLRINGVVDVWPTRRRWMPTHRSLNQFAETYRDINHLKRIVANHESQASKEQKAAKWFAKLPAGDPVAKRPVEQIPTWEDFARRFDSRPGEQAKLFNPGPAKPPAVRSSRDPLAMHNARKLDEWGPKFEPDPNFEKPPWE